MKSPLNRLFGLGAPLFVCLISLKGITSEEGCFDRYQLSCQPPESSTIDGEVVDAQQICFELEVEPYTLGFFDLFNLTTHAELINEIPADSDLCNQARQVYHLCYWCDPDKSSWCFNLLLDEDFDPCEAPQEIDDTVDREAACEEFLSLPDFPASTDLCYRMGQSFYSCDICIGNFLSGDGDFAYLGADTSTKRKAIVWMSRASAILAFFGASFIIWDVLHSRQNREKVYHQLMFGMACFDICTAVAWAFATAPLPKEDKWFDFIYSDIYGAKGNEATCTAQGFFIQLGLTSVLYNVTLSAYYVMVLVKNRTEQRLKRARWVLHGVPLVVGFGLAFGGLPLYKDSYTPYGCYGDTLLLMGFGVIPIGISIVAITACMLRVYCKVRRQFRRSRRWRLGAGNADSLERKVFWQCLSYVLAFYITWPILFVGYIFGYNDFRMDDYPYGLTVTVAFVAPLQGFSNFLVYVRPRWERYLETRKRYQAEMRPWRSLFSFLFLCQSETSVTGTQADSQATSRIVDPSVMIAIRNETIQSQEASVLDAIPEVDTPVEQPSDVQQAVKSNSEEEKKEDELDGKANLESFEEEKSYDDLVQSMKADI